MIEISFLGHAAFKIKTSSATIITDPFDPQMVKGLNWQTQKADIICVSHGHEDHNFLAGIEGGVNQEQPFVISGPGEYEVQGVRIEGVASFHDEARGARRGKNTIYKLDLGEGAGGGVTLVHLGDLGHLLSEEQVKQLEMTDILLVPCGGIFTLDPAGAAKVVEQLEPYLVIPMHYGIKGSAPADEWGLAGVEEFLKELGAEPKEAVDKIKIKSRADLPEEREVVILKI